MYNRKDFEKLGFVIERDDSTGNADYDQSSPMVFISHQDGAFETRLTHVREGMNWVCTIEMDKGGDYEMLGDAMSPTPMTALVAARKQMQDRINQMVLLIKDIFLLN